MLLDFLFPQRSVTGVPGTALTAEEAAQLRVQPYHLDRTALRRRGVEHVDALHAACRYRGEVLPEVIRLFKYARQPQWHNRLAELIVKASFPHDESTVLCPVPLHWTRAFWRGFNQATLLAWPVSAAYGIPVRHCLRRLRPTGHQAHRTRKDRWKSMENAFVCSQKPDASTVILVDDIATTCATLNACAAALKRAGVEHVAAWTVAYD